MLACCLLDSFHAQSPSVSVCGVSALSHGLSVPIKGPRVYTDQSSPSTSNGANVHTVGGCVHSRTGHMWYTHTQLGVQYCINNNITRAVVYDLVW